LRKIDLGSSADEAIQRVLTARLLAWLLPGETLVGLLAATFVVLTGDRFTTSRRAFAATFASDGRTPTDRRISLAEA
jgi:hypothetical protein